MLYIFIIILAVISIIFSVFARKNINNCKTEEEKRIVKARWQLICGLLGAACIIIAGILVFTMF